MQLHRAVNDDSVMSDAGPAGSPDQQNRNPFIDHPELSEYIWGDKTGTPWYIGAESEPRIAVGRVKVVGVGIHR